MSSEEKQQLKEEFVNEDRVEEQWQRLFYLNRLPTKKELFEFVSMTNKIELKKGDKHGVLMNERRDLEQIVFSEDENNAPNRVVVMDDLMNEAFNSRDKEIYSRMNLLMTKLSHHDNISVLIVCHELYPKGRNSVLLEEQLTGMHLHSVANTQKAKNYVCNYLTDDDEKCQYNQLFKEHMLDIGDNVKGRRRGSIFIKFPPMVSEDSGLRAGRFLTFNERDHSVIHKLTKR